MAVSYRRVYLLLLIAGVLALVVSLGVGFATADPCPTDASGLTAGMMPWKSAEERAAMEIWWFEDLGVGPIVIRRTSPYTSVSYHLEKDIFGDCHADPDSRVESIS